MSKKCETCGSIKNIINHHTSYEPEIIIPLCHSCHTKIHVKNRVKKEYTSNTLSITRTGTTYIPKLMRHQLKYPKEIAYVEGSNVIVLFNPNSKPKEVLLGLNRIKERIKIERRQPICD